jgi:7-keto-8-aminopelargonate synthetase-like enzyme
MSVDSRHTSLADYVRFDSPDLFTKTVRFQDFLSDGRQKDLGKYLLQYVEFQGGSARVRERLTGKLHEVQVFCSADYLDLARHPEVVEAAHRAVDRFGVSVSSVPLIAGSTILHDELEKQLATFLGAESCVLFPTGQAANASTIAALCSAQDFVVIDKQVHYSVLEGVKLTGAKWKSFRHSDVEHLETVLRTVRERHSDVGILVIAEGVYGLDGDIAPLPELMAVVRRHDARLLLDDAHATGITGPRGAGTVDHYGMIERPDIVMGSFSKAFGSVGGFIAAPVHVTDYLRFFAKSISFSIGLPPANAAAALQSLRLIRENPSLVAQLKSRCTRLRDSLLAAGFSDVARSRSAIMSIMVGSEAAVKEATRDLFNAGVWIEGLAFPAVSRGHERIRFRARLSHTDEQIERAVRIVTDTAKNHGFLKRKVASVGAFSALNTDVGNTGRLLELIYKSGARRALPPSWFTPESKRRLVEKSDFWEDVAFVHEWFHSGGQSYAAAVCAILAHDGRSTFGGLGQFAWMPGEDAALTSCIRDSIHWFRRLGATKVYAPWHAPMQLLGAGVPATNTLPDSRPFLESTNDPQLSRLLPAIGFQPAWSNTYIKLDLSNLAAPDPRALCSNVVFRNIDREHLRREVECLTPLLNETVSTLPHCSILSERLLYGVASDLRDLILPGFWRLAFQGDELVGFIAAFPNVTEAFSQACGMADVADLVKVSDALDNIEEGFVAWMGVSPRFAAPDRLAETMLGQVLSTMKRRGLKDTWLSWELHDGRCQLTDADFASYDITSRLNYDVYEYNI